MGNCAIKPKVLKDSEEDLPPVEQDSTAPVDHNKALASENVAPNAAEEAAAAAKRSEKGKDIMIEDDIDENHKRQSLSLLFHENKPIEKNVIDITPTNPEPVNKTGASSEILNLDHTSAIMSPTVKEPEIFDVKTRDDLEVKIPEDNSKVKTPETPKAKEAKEEEVNFSENWEVKFPEELEAKKPSEVVKEEPKLPVVPEVVKEEPNVPEVPEVVSVPPELSEVKLTKESDVSDVVLEDKNVPEVSKEVKAAEKDLEVKSSDDLEIKVSEAKTPETTNGEVKVDQEAKKIKVAEESEVPVFVDAQGKIQKPETTEIKVMKDKETVLPKEEEEKEKDLLSLEKQVKDKETTLPDLGKK